MLRPAAACAWLSALPALLVLARLGALVRAQDACAYVHSGSQRGVPYHLAVTYLFPGLADWSIMVPRPPECAGGFVAGYVARVCDHDAAPRLRATPQGALVQRAGWLRGPAAVYCTVFCAFPRLPPRLPELPALPAVPSRSKHVTTEPAAATTFAKALLSTEEHSSEAKSTIVATLSSTSSSSSEEEESAEESIQR
ncbi:uncharacterized protein LOC118273264 [Spodoptera frugiperda]|uniref:Uncharacterized protein LOC118273264 n=1 Tax=Spodoptera frugiperda TaxID=7108 RepID=A0A9R0DAJ4_SPOFR|nr:uncharacterized protein LOC118273264 [Spodoptera frugiperda]